MPLYKRTRKLGKTDYEQVQHPGSSEWQFTHGMVADTTLGPRAQVSAADGYCEVVHHQDINPKNNRPDNLMKLTRQAHIELHGSLMHERWKNPEFRALMAAPARIQKAGAAIKRSWANASPERRAERIAAVLKNASATHRTDVTVESIADVVRSGVLKRVDVAEALQSNEVIVLARVKKAGFVSWRAFVSDCGLTPARAHDYGAGRPRRFSIADIERAYDEVVGDDGKATLADLVSVLDCSMSQVFRTLKYNGYDSWVSWKQEIGQRNHKVVSVAEGAVEDVYDIEVPETENFALSSGVFVHNCKLYFIAHLAAQRAAVGTRKGTMPKGASTNDKNKFIRALADLGVAQHIALPGPEWNVEILKEGGTLDFLAYINHHNSQMSKSVLAGFFDSNQGAGPGDSSLVDFGKEDDNLFMLMLKTIMDEIAALINHHIIPKFIDWNFGSGKYPKFKWGSFTDEQKKALTATFTALSVAGQSLTVTPEFVFELEKYMAGELGLEIDYKAIEEEKAKAKEAAAAQAEADQSALASAVADANATGGDGSGGTPPGSGGGAPDASGGAPAPPGGGLPMPPGISLTFPSDEDESLVALAGDLLRGLGG